MKVFDSKLFKLFTLEHGEKPQDIIPKEIRSAYIMEHRGDIWAWNRTPGHVALTPIKNEKKETILKQFPDIAHLDTTKAYAYDIVWGEYTFTPEDFRYVMAYFRTIYDKHKTEAAVLLMINHEKRSWKILFVPQVDCSGGGVNYLYPRLDIEDQKGRTRERYEDFLKIKGNDELMQKCIDEMSKLTADGYKIYGTIHSHCNFAAFHSGTDDSDEIHFDGMHITIGNVRSNWSYSSRMMLSGCPFVIDPFELFKWPKEEIEKDIDSVQIDPFHMELIQPEVGKNTGTYTQAVGFYTGENVGSGSRNYAHGYNEYFNWDSYDSKEKSQTDILLDNVIYEQAAIRLFDLKEGEGLIVRSPYYYKNKERFPNSRFIRIEDIEYSQELLDQHEAYKLEMEKAPLAIEEDPTEIRLLSSERLGSIKAGNLATGDKIRNVKQYIITHKKAKKITNK